MQEDAAHESIIQKLREVYGECLLRQGKWRTGFIEKTANLENTNTLTKKGDIKIFCDGTLGETLFYSRWLSYINEKSLKATVYAQQPLLTLLKNNFKNIDFIALKNNQYHEKQKHLRLALLPLQLKDWEYNNKIFEF